MLLFEVPLAVSAAAANAVASVLQRRAARTAPPSYAFRAALIWDLARNPWWLGGIGALIAGFLFQAAALTRGGLALVQPLLVAELPITMLLAARMFRTRIDLVSWIAIGMVTAGLASFLAAASPSPGDRIPGLAGWLVSAGVTGAVITSLAVVAVGMGGAARAVLLGVCAGLAFAYTAVLMKRATRVLEYNDLSALPVTWSVYGMVAAGLCSLFLLQNALQSGPLVAVQPALTVTDPVASTAYGVVLFGEDIRTGPWILLELAGLGLILYGSVLLSRSAPLRRDVPVMTAEG
ncbi:DMT family transporter [Microbispora sp. RL4-1S]|uniref:DMT family transporter n=1 Tax=Microbispora oryzae TaxID=2806554 RepID=A0A940WNP1_9ACTN|nr:DMT family transporter [Microbispora oryzae]MBP2704034.1 DMT family transporter [Microbispora oryzae]